MRMILWLILGLLAGGVAHLALQGKTRRGFLASALLGLLGTLLGGWLASLLGFFGGMDTFDWRSPLIALLGTLSTVGLYSYVTDKVEVGRRLSRTHPPPTKEPNRPAATSSPPPEPTPLRPDSKTGRERRPGQNKSIFLSYRRADSSDVTGRMYDRLRAHFGSEHVFKDVDSIPLGVDFRRHLEATVSTCSVLIAVIGTHWTAPPESASGSSLYSPNDFVRIEIETALKRGIPVIPALVQGASMPAQEALPPSLQELSYRNWIHVRPDPDFHRDLDRLISDLEDHLHR